MVWWPPFGKKLLTQKTYVRFVLCLFVILVVSHLGFEGVTLVLIVPVPDYCLLTIFIAYYYL